MINIVTPQVSPRRSDRIHPDRDRPPPRPDSTTGGTKIRSRPGANFEVNWRRDKRFHPADELWRVLAFWAKPYTIHSSPSIFTAKRSARRTFENAKARPFSASQIWVATYPPRTTETRASHKRTVTAGSHGFGL
eukprot:3458108-Prymnesium_polylepis.1